MNVTETDLAIASAIYPVLIDCARQSPPKTLAYGALLERARSRFPNIEAVQKAIPIGMGRKLDVVRMFLDERELPNLTSLVVNAATGEVGTAFGDNAERVRAEVASFDWSTVSEEFDLHIAGLRTKMETRPRPKLTREEAKALMFEYFRANSRSLPKIIGEHRETIIELISGGMAPDEAFEAALARARAAVGSASD